MLKQRKEILAIIIIQKTILKRARLSGDGFNSKQFEEFNKDKSLKARISKSNTISKDNIKSTRTQEEDKKRKAEVANNNLKTSSVY